MKENERERKKENERERERKRMRERERERERERMEEIIHEGPSPRETGLMLGIYQGESPETFQRFKHSGLQSPR